ncbi:hypothetical protein [Occallatibacter riparius]|uniref:Uncharacterized protein n=1 Tax=Occallatibacter riparius TaxID=1002689 RepID=A0A9J7BXB0_9BACT|nr:hypothetical protein [Occallatibacter riparius]UWZ85757.1 hypothetical protein MOP44_07380 [Occallatibacter riparius]
MFAELNRLLSPFRRGFAWYIVLTLIRQAMVVGGGYGLVLLIRTYEHNSAQSVLIAVAVLAAYKLLLDGLDQAMGWKFAKHVSYPMFRQLSVGVFSKLLQPRSGLAPVGIERRTSRRNHQRTQQIRADKRKPGARGVPPARDGVDELVPAASLRRCLVLDCRTPNLLRTILLAVDRGEPPLREIPRDALPALRRR